MVKICESMFQRMEIPLPRVEFESLRERELESLREFEREREREKQFYLRKTALVRCGEM